MGVRTISKTIDLSQLPKESKYITEINDTGITIHPKVYNGSSSIERSSYIQLDGTGMELFNSSGISIAKYGEDIRLGNVNEGKLLITAGGQGHTYEDAGTYIIDENNDVLAQFLSSGAQIGQIGASHLEMDYHSMRMVDLNGNSYLYVSDLRGTDGKARIVDTFSGGAHRYWLTFTATSSDYTVTGTNWGSKHIVYKGTEYFDFDDDLPSAAIVTVEYYTESEDVKAYTIGMRGTGDVGASSSVVGTRCVAEGKFAYAEGLETTSSGYDSHAQNLRTIAGYDSQTAIGRYNDNQSTSAFEIGNGTSDNARSNALTVDWNGNVWCAGGITATPTAITLTYSQCTTGSYTRCYRIGNIVFLSFNINVTTATASYDYITGLPPALGGGWAASSGFGSGAMTRWWITTSGTLRADGTPTAGWHNGSVVYICQ